MQFLRPRKEQQLWKVKVCAVTQFSRSGRLRVYTGFLIGSVMGLSLCCLANAKMRMAGEQDCANNNDDGGCFLDDGDARLMPCMCSP